MVRLQLLGGQVLLRGHVSAARSLRRLGYRTAMGRASPHWAEHQFMLHDTLVYSCNSFVGRLVLMALVGVVDGEME
jgi:hypothetical protein